MSAARVAVNWWTVGVLAAVLAIVVWSYVDARHHGALPISHPWPAVSLIGGAALAALTGYGKGTGALLVVRALSSLLIMTGATLYLWSFL